jgi:hypothetical protein
MSRQDALGVSFSYSPRDEELETPLRLPKKAGVNCWLSFIQTVGRRDIVRMADINL